MASPKCLPFFLLTTLIFSLVSQSQARDSQFFSKVTRHRDNPETTTTTTTTNTNNNNNQFKETNEFSTFSKQEVDPTFIPQTSGTGYGLYGHDTGVDPPTTTTTTTSLYNMDNNNNNNNYQHGYNDHHKNYAPQLQGLNEFTNNDNKKYYNYNNNNNNNKNYNNYGNEGAGYYGGVEKQGMSDTRFLENGMYFYDVNAEKEKNNYGANYVPYTHNYNTNNNNYGNNYKEDGFVGNYRGNYHEFGNYGGNYHEFHNNGNAMQGYQNQKPEEEEFEFDP